MTDSSTRAARPAAPEPKPRLLEHACGALLDHVAGADPRGWRFAPLVIVSTAAEAATAGLQAAAVARGVTLADLPATIWDGHTLGRQIAAALAGDRLERLGASLAASRLVVVDGIDHVSGADALQALVHLLDASLAAGASWCVSLGHPSAAVLGPQIASRLRGGLVVPTPPAAPASPVAAGSPPTPGRVFRAVARHHDVPIESLLGPARHRSVAAARSLAMYLARRLTGLSLQSIGEACGGRDHTTVLHGVRLCAARLARDHALAADVERLVADLSRSDAPGPRRRRASVGSASPARTVDSRRRSRRRPA